MKRAEIMGEQYFEISYQRRSDGRPLGTPETIVIACAPQEWRNKAQCDGSSLLSATPITREQFMMRTLSAERSLDNDWQF